MADRGEIIDCLARYARGMDREDRELVRSAYHDGAIDDHSAFVGSVDDFIEWSFAHNAAQVHQQHYLTNHHIEFDGDVAYVESYYTYVGVLPSGDKPVKMYGGRYVDRFERRDGRWAIADRVLVPSWRAELSEPVPVAIPGMRVSQHTVTRDRTDISYERPPASG